MTCAGRHAENSRQSSLQRGEDGLSPHVSREVANRGYILTCSSHVVGDGLKLELGENHNVWDDIYRGRLVDDTAQFVGRAAMAKVIRESDERNIKRWADETEAALKKSGDKQE